MNSKSNFLLYLAQNEIVEPDSWFLEYDKTVAFSLSEYNLKTDNESIVLDYPGEFVLYTDVDYLY
ncbi:hypothetical protein HK103_004437 [Boothiomyces macroporosus]|uniref:Uncharacterized protein n=1 Tax=Boothiomyces macroporosus TaxID=261099 RepID=A0AAD5UGE8_9FUNG|nr:hypothetical protein HK103_004437 [Boothiomyces macroporosus]